MKKITFLAIASLYAFSVSAQTSANNENILGNSSKTPLELATCITQNWANSKQEIITRQNLEANNKAFTIPYVNSNQIVVNAIVMLNVNEKDTARSGSSLRLETNKNTQKNAMAYQNAVDLAKSCL